MRTDDIGFTSSDSITWWYVDLGGLKSVYNIRIQFKDYGDEYSKLLCYFNKKKKCVKFRTKLTHFEFFFQTLIALNFGPNQRFFKMRYECKSTFFFYIMSLLS